MIDYPLLLVLAALVAFALLILWITALSNLLAFPRLRQGESPQRPPVISFLVPARNEAATIRETVQHLLAQNYPSFELIVLDDGSSDRTAQFARTAGGEDPRFILVEGGAGDPPPGWAGKNWACQRLASHAQGEILIFTDADVRWEPAAASALVALMERSGADLLTVWPTQRAVSAAERLVVPLVDFAIFAYLPLVAVHYLPFAAFAAANGQCMAWRREAYGRVGGHEAVKGTVLEDVKMARLAKSKGLRLRMAQGNKLLRCRMYHNWDEVRDGFAKNLLAGHGDSLAFLGLSTLFHWMVFLGPWLWLMLGWIPLAQPGWPWWPLGLLAAGMGLRAMIAVASGQRAEDALQMPASVLLMTIIAAQAARWRFRGGPQWKGRSLPKP